jgi:trigger factor
MSETILETKDYQSEKIDLRVDIKPACHISMTVKVRPDLMNSSRKKAIREIAKDVSVPGFRKGKVPADWVEKNYPDAIAQGWDKALADQVFVEAQGLAKIPLLQGNTRISYKVNKLSEEGGEVSFDFESEPLVPEISLSNISLPEVREDEITEERVQETLKTIQMFYAKWRHVEDRPVQEGDFVVLDIDDLDAETPTQVFSNARFEVNRKTMAFWMHDLIVGKNKGDAVEGVSEANPEDSEELKKQFQKKRVKIHIKEVEEAVLPPVDNEFASKLGTPDVETLHTKLHSLLKKQAHERMQNELREKLADSLVHAVKFDLPSSLLEKEANFRMNALMKEPNFAKEWNELMTPEQKEAKKKEVVEHAKNALMLFYICRHIIIENKIPLSQEEFLPNYDSLIDAMFADPARVHLHNQSKEQQAVEYSRFLIAKAQDFLIDKLRSSK